jgi:toluene monooxygenase system protein D
VQARLVGPVIRGVDRRIADAVVDAVIADNPEAEVSVEDHGGYVRISCPSRCRLTRASLEEALDEPFPLPQLEPALSAFAGRMRYIGDDEVEWYLERED